METKVYANKDWQNIGKIPEAGRLYAEGRWCFNVKERDTHTCNCEGDGAGPYVNKISQGDQRYPYSGDGAKVGQLVFRVGKTGMPEALGLRGEFGGGEEVWMRINDDSGLADNDGYLTLRFVSAAQSSAVGQRMTPTNSYGDPIGTQYTRNAAGGYDKVQ
jgi:hypothetical protein